MGTRGPIGSPFGRRAESRRKNGQVVDFPADGTIPSATKPSIVKSNRRASAYWDSYAPALAATGRLNAAFESGFAAICLLWAELMECDELIRKDGRWLLDAKGRKYLHPAAKVRGRAMRDYLAWAKQYALTPETRNRAHLDPPKQDPNDPWAALKLE